MNGQFPQGPGSTGSEVSFSEEAYFLRYAFRLGSLSMDPFLTMASTIAAMSLTREGFGSTTTCTPQRCH